MRLVLCLFGCARDHFTPSSPTLRAFCIILRASPPFPCSSSTHPLPPSTILCLFVLAIPVDGGMDACARQHTASLPFAATHGSSGCGQVGLFALYGLRVYGRLAYAYRRGMLGDGTRVLLRCVGATHTLTDAYV